MKHSAALAEVHSVSPSPEPANEALALVTQALRLELDRVAAGLQKQIDALGDQLESQSQAQQLRSDDLNHELSELRLSASDQLDDVRHDIELGHQHLAAELARLTARMEQGTVSRAGLTAALLDLADRSRSGSQS